MPREKKQCEQRMRGERLAWPSGGWEDSGWGVRRAKAAEVSEGQKMQS